MMHGETDSGRTSQPFHQAAAWTEKHRPALASVVRPFAALFSRRAAVIEALGPQIGALPDDPSGDGVPLLTRYPLPHDDGCMAAAMHGMLPALGEVFPELNDDFDAIAAALDGDPRLPNRLAQAWQAGRQETFDTAAGGIGASAQALGFAVNWSITAVYNAWRGQWTRQAPLPLAASGHCPFCGSLPAVTLLSRPEGPTDEYIKGGGGQKYLHCALCGYEWRFPRTRCPVCETDDKAHRMYYQAAEGQGERIDACRNCGHYLLCVDLRERDGAPPLEMAAVGMVHLDVLARDKGFKPVVWTLWNRIDET